MKLLSLAFVAGLCTTLLAAEATDSFTIDEFEFSWKVAESGKAKMEIEKTNDATTVRLSDDNHGLRLSPADAEKVADALRTTDTYWSKIRGPKDAQETVKAGECEVTFYNSGKYGFSVLVREKGAFSLSTVRLDKKQAHALEPYLKKSTAMAKHVDRLIESALNKQ